MPNGGVARFIWRSSRCDKVRQKLRYSVFRTKPSFQEPENTIPQLVFGLVLKVRWGWTKGAEVIEAASAFTELV